MWCQVLGLLLWTVHGSLEAQRAQEEAKVFSLFEPRMAEAMGRISGLTYCGSYLEGDILEKCPECEAAGFKVVPGSVEPVLLEMKYGNVSAEDANFFIMGEMQFQATKGCFAATRGSITDINWVQNGMMKFVNPHFKECPSCAVKEGYFSIYQAILPTLTKYLDSHGCGKGENPIWITGHSLGGAVAAIMIGGLTDLGYNVALSYILEPAMSGDTTYREYFRRVVAKKHEPVPLFSLSNGWDMVPRDAGHIKLGYAPIPYDIHSDPWSGQLSVCFDDDNFLEPSNCPRVDRNSWWHKKSLFIDHLILWYSSGHFMVTGAVPEACKANPNWFKFHLQWFLVGTYTNFFGSGLWGFVLKMNLCLLLCICSACCCCYWCCYSGNDRGNDVHPYDKLPERSGP